MQHYDELLRYCRRLTSDGNIIHDIVQETYERFLATQQTGKPIASPAGLLYEIARHVVTDMHRRTKARNHVNLDELSLLEEPADDAAGPGDLLAAKQMARAYDAKIQTLPPRCREAFALRMFDGLSHAQIAEKMGISCSTVEKHIARAMLACQQCRLNLAARN